MLRKWIFFFILFLSLVSVSFAVEQTVITMNVQGVPCPFCAKVLVENLKKLPNIQTVVISSDFKKLSIKGKPGKTVDVSLVNKTIASSGYLSLETQQKSIQAGSSSDATQRGAHIEIKNQPCANCHN